MLEKIMNLVYPPDLYCICCGNLIDETRVYHLCDHCMSHIRWDLEPPVIRDGLPMIRCAQYGIYERTLNFSLKYNGKRYIARSIGEMMYDRLEASGIVADVVVPVPMNKNKENHRGFNQTVLIGRYLAKYMGCQLGEHVLRRQRDTEPMRGLSPVEREQNIRGAIGLGPAASTIAGKRVLLLDDFFTTGSTALECKKMLEKAGPSQIIFIAFAAKY